MTNETCFTHSKLCVCGYRADNSRGMDQHIGTMERLKLAGHTRVPVVCRICHPVETIETDEIETRVFTCLCGAEFALLASLLNHIQTEPSTIIRNRFVRALDQQEKRHNPEKDIFYPGTYSHGVTDFRELSKRGIERVFAALAKPSL